MGRKRRIEMAGGVFHVYARGNNQRALFADDRDRARYLAILADAVRELSWQWLAYCLMTNHVHLIVLTRHPNLGRGMFVAHGAYARSFNARHGRINQDWPWSSHAAVLDGTAPEWLDVPRLVGYFGGQDRYEAFVADARARLA